MQPIRKLRKFGLVVGTGLTLVGLVSWYRGHQTVPMALWLVAGALVAAALVYPRSLGPVEKAWMAFGHVLAWVNTRIILSILFAVVLVPIGLIMRLFKDPLDRKIHDGRASYWISRTPREATPERYERQF